MGDHAGQKLTPREMVRAHAYPVLAADVPFRPGDRALLLTQAHGAGISHRPVRCCWQHLHPSDPRLQCLGLRFEGKDDPKQPPGSAEG